MKKLRSFELGSKHCIIVVKSKLSILVIWLLFLNGRFFAGKHFVTTNSLIDNSIRQLYGSFHLCHF